MRSDFADEGSDSEDKTIPTGDVGKVTSDKKETRQTNPDQTSNTQKPMPPQTMKDLSETFVKANSSSSDLNKQMSEGTKEICGPSSTGTVSRNLTKEVQGVESEGSSQQLSQPTGERKPDTVASPNVPSSQDQGTEGESGSTQGCAKPVKSEENLASDQGIPGNQEKPMLSTSTVDKVADSAVKVDSKALTDLKMREKGDMVVVGSGSSSPVSEASANVKKGMSFSCVGSGAVHEPGGTGCSFWRLGTPCYQCLTARHKLSLYFEKAISSNPKYTD